MSKHVNPFVYSSAVGLVIVTLVSPSIIATIPGELVARPTLIDLEGGKRLDSARERAIRHCMAVQDRDPHDGYEGKKGGGLQWHYQACMVEDGQRP
jgi:hypothetical protein